MDVDDSGVLSTKDRRAIVILPQIDPFVKSDISKLLPNCDINHSYKIVIFDKLGYLCYMNLGIL
jgi:precorrin-6B methylase 1